MPTKTVKSKSKVTIPKDVRELKGMIARPRKPVSVAGMREAVARRARRPAR